MKIVLDINRIFVLLLKFHYLIFNIYKMNKVYSYVLVLLLFCVAQTQSEAQVFFSEDFEGTMNATTNIPTNWTETTAGASDGIYDVGDNLLANSAGYWPVPVHTQFAQTNDDACNCDKSDDKLILPLQDFTSYAAVNLQVDLYMDGQYGSTGKVEVSTDNGTTWTEVYTIPLVNGLWQDSSIVALNAYAGSDSILVAFKFEDNAGWATGLGVDNVSLIGSSSPVDDLAAVSANGVYTTIPITQVPATGMPLDADVLNNGSAAIVDAVVTANVYDLGTGTVIQTTNSTATNVAAGSTTTINAGTFTPAAPGTYAFEFITSMASVTDIDNSNDTVRYVFFISGDGSYARDNFTLAVELGLGTTFGELGNIFDYPNANYKMDSVLFYFNPNTVGDTTEVKIYDVVAGVPNTLIGTSGLIIVSNTDTAGVLKMVPVTNLSGGPLSITSSQVFVALTDSYTGFVGLGFGTEIYTPGGTFANIAGGSWTDMANLGFANPAIIRPYVSFDCSVLTLSTAVTSSYNGADVSCYASTDGEATATAAGTSNYAYTWDANANAQNTAIATGLTAGVYVVSVTDSVCTTIDTITLTAPDSFSIAVDSFANVSCNGGANGLVAVTIGGATAPYSYNWSNGATTDDLFGLTAGTYFGTVTDANGCIFVAPVPIAEPTLLVATATDAGNGQVANAAASGGTPPYSFQWDAAANNQTAQSASNLTPGTYSVTVTDANGCTSDTSVTILATNINTIEGIGSLNMFPNPADAQLMLDIQLERAMNVSVRVLNVTGQTVIQSQLGTIQTQSKVLDLNKLNDGVYTVQFNLGTEMISKKLIVSKR